MAVWSSTIGDWDPSFIVPQPNTGVLITFLTHEPNYYAYTIVVIADCDIHMVEMMFCHFIDP